ncbi:MAG: pyruvate formate-lyase-activating protein [Mycoplasmoidaceae bacterium]
MSITAKVFKTETFGAVDGPGVRLVIFLQGCSFRCQYCHNPESWNLNNPEAKEMSVEDIISLFKRNKAFYSKGGITLSGGEPMLQADFIKALAKECKAQNIHLAIDTSACNFEKNKQIYEDLLDDINLWIVDIKSLDQNEHQTITGSSYLAGVEFVKFLEEKNKPYWIRQVVAKTINTDNKHLDALAQFLSTLKSCERYELLSFHKLAMDKYKKMGLEYPYKDIPLLSNQEFEQLNIYLFNKLNN